MSDGGEGLLDVLGGANRIDDRHRTARSRRRGAVAARPPDGRDRDGPGERPHVGGRRRGQRPARRDDCRDGRADRPGPRERGPPDHRRPRRVGDDGRRARRDRGAAQPGPAAHGRAAGGVRRAHPVRRRRRRCSPHRRAPARRRSGCSPAGWSSSPAATATELGVDVTEIDGGGAAGGLAGGLAALGGRLVAGFDLVAEHVELEERVAAADVVVTGEGYLDAQSLDGKVVGGVCELARCSRPARRRRSSATPMTTPPPSSTPAPTSPSCRSSSATASSRALARTPLVHRARHDRGAHPLIIRVFAAVRVRGARRRARRTRIVGNTRVMVSRWSWSSCRRRRRAGRRRPG